MEQTHKPTSTHVYKTNIKKNMLGYRKVETELVFITDRLVVFVVLFCTARQRRQRLQIRIPDWT